MARDARSEQICGAAPQAGAGDRLRRRAAAAAPRADLRSSIAAPTSLPSAIVDLQSWLKTRKEMRHVELAQRDAADFRDMEPQSVDTVILNSVIQYFPDANYLLAVLEHAIGLVQPGGRIVRRRHPASWHCCPSFTPRCSSPMRRHASASQQLKERIALAIAQEKELVIDPDFFRGFGGAVSADRGGRHSSQARANCDNELTRYRYDVVLHVGERPHAGAEDVVEWNVSDGSLADISSYLGANDQHRFASAMCRTNGWRAISPPHVFSRPPKERAMSKVCVA